MAYPTDLPSFSVLAGTTLVATDDHANRHNTEGSAITALAQKVGVGAGTPTADKLLIGTGNGTATWGTTVNNANFGSPTVTLGSDATGDVLYRSAGGTLTRLGIGSNGQYLTTNGTTPSWGTVASTTLDTCKVITDAGQTTTHNTWLPIPLATEEWDTNTMHAAGTPTRVTIKRDGKYLCVSDIRWAANGTSLRSSAFAVDGSRLSTSGFVTFTANADVGDDMRYTLSTILNLTATQYVEIHAVQASGGSLAVNASLEVHQLS